MSELLPSPIRANSSSGISDEKTSSKIGLRRALQVLLDGGSERIAIDVRLSPDELPGIQRGGFSVPWEGEARDRKGTGRSGSSFEGHQPYFIFFPWRSCLKTQPRPPDPLSLEFHVSRILY